MAIEDAFDVRHEGVLAFIYHFGVSHVNNKSWVISDAEVDHAESTNVFFLCMPPTIENVVYSKDDWRFNADWDTTEPCIPGLDIAYYQFRWGIITGDGEDDVDDRYHVTLQPHQSSHFVDVPSILQSTARGVKLYKFGAVPHRIANGRWFDGPSYLVPSNVIGRINISALIESFSVDRPRVVTGETAMITLDVHTWRTTGAWTYAWQQKSGNSWVPFTGRVVNTGDVSKASPSFSTAGTRTFRVSATHRLPITGDPGYDGEPVRLDSDEISVEWTEPSSGTLSTSDYEIEVGDDIRVFGSYTVQQGSRATFSYTSPYFSETSDCSSSNANDVANATTSGTITDRLRSRAILPGLGLSSWLGHD